MLDLSRLMPQTTSFWDHPIDKLEEALNLRKQIAALQSKLSSMFGSEDEVPATVKYAAAQGGTKRGGGMSAEGRARIAAAQKARWAKKKGGQSSSVASASASSGQSQPTKMGRGGKRTMSPETIAKMRASQQARWAKAKGATPASTSTISKTARAGRAKAGITDEGRAKLAAAMKARWAARKKGAPALNAPKK